MKLENKNTFYQLPNHALGGPLTMVLGLRKSVSSAMISTAVVRGLPVVDVELAASGVGNAAKRVLAGGGTVTVWICV